MSPTPNECVETVKKVMAKVMHEKDALVARLNAMNKRIEEEKDLVAKVRLKVEWAEEKERSVKAMNTIVASLQRALAEDDMGETAPAARSTHGSTASREASDSGNVSNVSDASSVVTRPHGASSQSFTHKHASPVDRNQADFEITIANIDHDFSLEASQDAAPSLPLQKAHRAVSEEAGAAPPRQKEHCTSSEPPRAPASSPLRQRPARLAGNDGEEPCGIVRRLSNEAAQISQQVRRSVTRRVGKFSSSMLRRVGWDPALQESQRVWDYSI
mmetsp:Transcript_52555/g.124413  ORF Transcript_52555/g.124413 Transcript_52555/m.124413 type:complete len:272 (+) Transcript_52555:66-881(+)